MHRGSSLDGAETGGSIGVKSRSVCQLIARSLTPASHPRFTRIENPIAAKLCNLLPFALD
jgi:hypothetical protein